jgi:1-acyl-sn-glycerol-3-phosphate acyltransferase
MDVVSKLEPAEDAWGTAHLPWTPDRLWRLFGTAFSFALFGVAGLIMAGVFFPLVWIALRDRVRREAFAQRSVHFVWRVYIEIMKAMGVATFEVEGVEALREARGTVVVANHPSLLDVVYLMAFMRRTRAVVKQGVWNNPFMHGVVAASGYIANSGDPNRLVADCATALKEGYNLCIFPEGSRTPAGQRRRYQRGFAYAAVEAGAPVLVLTIDVSPPTLRKGEPWYSIPQRRPHWTIRVRGRIDTAAAYGTEPPVRAARRLAQDVEALIEEHIRWPDSKRN